MSSKLSNFSTFYFFKITDQWISREKKCGKIGLLWAHRHFNLLFVDIQISVYKQYCVTKDCIRKQKWHEKFSWDPLFLREKLCCHLWMPPKPPWLAELVKALSLLYRNLWWFKPIRGKKLVADVCDQQPFEPGEWGLRVAWTKATK